MGQVILQEEGLAQKTPLVASNFVVGLPQPKFIKLKGIIKGKEVMVMIDTGANYNCVSIDGVERLGMPIKSKKGSV